MLGVTIRCDQSLSVKVAFGRQGTDTAAAEGGSASLPFATAAQTFASADTTEGGTYKEFAMPPCATIAQLVLSNSSGSTATVSYVDYDLDPLVVKDDKL